MKTFSQLNYEEQDKAIQYHLNELIFGIVENRIYFEEGSEIAVRGLSGVKGRERC